MQKNLLLIDVKQLLLSTYKHGELNVNYITSGINAAAAHTPYSATKLKTENRKHNTLSNHKFCIIFFAAYT